jgi:hypothetical protein
MDDFESFLGMRTRDLRREVAQRVFHDAHVRMTLSNMCAWNTDGFYAARSLDELIAGGITVDDLEHAFPVPADCPQWSNAQLVMGVVQRALVRRGWLDIANEGRGSTLRLVVSELAMLDWIDKMVVVSGGERMYLARFEQHLTATCMFWKMRGAGAAQILVCRLNVLCLASHHAGGVFRS